MDLDHTDSSYSTLLPLYEELGSTASELTTTSQYSSAAPGLLNDRLQALGLGNPIWSITVEPGTERSAQRFIGTLVVAENFPEKFTVSVVDPWTDPVGAGLSSKKKARAVLAQKALDVLEGMKLSKRVNGTASATDKLRDGGDDGVNWIGRVLGLCFLLVAFWLC